MIEVARWRIGFLLPFNWIAVVVLLLVPSQLSVMVELWLSSSGTGTGFGTSSSSSLGWSGSTSFSGWGSSEMLLVEEVWVGPLFISSSINLLKSSSESLLVARWFLGLFRIGNWVHGIELLFSPGVFSLLPVWNVGLNDIALIVLDLSVQSNELLWVNLRERAWWELVSSWFLGLVFEFLLVASVVLLIIPGVLSVRVNTFSLSLLEESNSVNGNGLEQILLSFQFMGVLALRGPLDTFLVNSGSILSSHFGYFCWVCCFSTVLDCMIVSRWGVLSITILVVIVEVLCFPGDSIELLDWGSFFCSGGWCLSSSTLGSSSSSCGGWSSQNF